MTQIHKAIISIPSFVGLIYMLILWFPAEFDWLTPTLEAYYYQLLTIYGLIIIQLIFLLKRLWKFTNISHSEKWRWTWLLIAFSLITSLIYIWRKDAEFLTMENKNLTSIK